MHRQLATRHNLPAQPMSFIGRESEIADITALLDDPACHLLTLIGPGGIGKTRLAIEVAERKLEAFPDGVFFVPLQPLTSHKHIVSAIATSVDYQFQPGNREPRQQLLDYFSQKTMLLIMDNFEHLLKGADLISDILATAPDVRVLVTSREALNLREEWVRLVQGLDVPEQEDCTTFEEYDAARLFVERVRQVNQEFSWSDERLGIARICRLVEGMPLGLEIAASWVRILSCEEIADEIQRNLDILKISWRNVPERHRSMQAVFDWSWDLLTEEERNVFCQTSVFEDSCTRDAAQAITNADVWILQSLVDKSFIRRDPEGGRYHIHELMRQYGKMRLEQTGETDTVRDAHMRYYADTLRQFENDLKSSRQIEALDAIETDFGNVRAAWNWAVKKHDVDVLRQTMEIVTLFCELRSRHLDGLDLLSNALNELNETSGEQFQSIQQWLTIFWIHLWQLRKQASESIRAQIEEILHIARQRDDQALITACLYELGQSVMIAGRYREALDIYEETVAHYRELADTFNAVRVLRGITCCYGWLGEEFLNERWNSHQEYLNLAREVGAPSSLAHAIHDDAFLVRTSQQDSKRYEHRLLEAHDLWETLGDKIHTGAVKAELAYLTALEGNHDRANQLATEAAQIAEDANYTMLRAFVFIVYGLLAILKKDYPQGEQHLKDAIALGDPRYTSLANIWLGISYLGQNSYEEAQRHFQQLLSDTHMDWDTQRLLSIIMLSALLLAHEGQKDYAAELLGWAFTTRDGFIDAPVEVTPLFTQQHMALKTELGQEAFQAASERGKSLELTAVVQNVLDALNGGEDVETPRPMHISAANEQLPEPLTDRELEVLSLLAEGLSNPEIADRLYISTGTVKVHTRHIYSKLDVSNRTEATATALKLNLT